MGERAFAAVHRLPLRTPTYAVLLTEGGSPSRLMLLLLLRTAQGPRPMVVNEAPVCSVMANQFRRPARMRTAPAASVKGAALK